MVIRSTSFNYCISRIFLVILALSAPSAWAQTNGVPSASSGRAAAEMHPEEIFSSLAGRVLLLTCELSVDDEAQASGVLVSADGFLVTNAHVVEGCRHLTATFISGAMRRSYEAALKYYDKTSDTAVLKIDGQPFDFFDLSARDVRVGERVYAIGNPRGLEQSMSEGIVSGLRAEDGASRIQHSAPISPGSSGGALISSRGELLGINSWYGKESQNLNFAVPASTLVSAYRSAQAMAGSLRFPNVPSTSQSEAPPMIVPPTNAPAPGPRPTFEQGDEVARPKDLAALENGDAYRLGRGVQLDYPEALKWYRKAAEYGNALAQFQLGFMLSQGQGAQQDYAEAAKWYRKAADQGYSPAQTNLGKLYQDGTGVPQDYSEAERWLRLAADQGDAIAQVKLGVAYQEAKGVAQDYQEASRWFRLSADQGNLAAQLLLAGMYNRGQGVPQDYKESTRWYRLAAEQGDAFGQVSVGLAYREAWGVPLNYGEAVRWFRLAADSGNSLGQVYLGFQCASGQGVPMDYKEAAKWFRLAAEQGDVYGQFNLGSLYEKGHGVSLNLVLAHMWYNLAVSRSPIQQQKSWSGVRDSLAAKMTAAQIAEAQKLAREWKPSGLKVSQP
jgi:TPR repeat protein